MTKRVLHHIYSYRSAMYLIDGFLFYHLGCVPPFIDCSRYISSNFNLKRCCSLPVNLLICRIAFYCLSLVFKLTARYSLNQSLVLNTVYTNRHDFQHRGKCYLFSLLDIKVQSVSNRWRCYHNTVEHVNTFLTGDR